MSTFTQLAKRDVIRAICKNKSFNSSNLFLRHSEGTVHHIVDISIDYKTKLIGPYKAYTIEYAAQPYGSGRTTTISKLCISRTEDQLVSMLLSLEELHTQYPEYLV